MANATSTPVTPPVGPATPPGMGVNERNPTLSPRTQTPEAAPDMGAPPSTGPVTINIPTPIAGAQAPPRPVSKRGMMASVLTGALEGAKVAMKKGGEAAKQVAQNSSMGQRIRQANATREETKTRTAQMQQQTTDAHQENILRMNGISLDNMHKAAENAQIESLYSLETASVKATLIGQLRAQNEADRKLFTTLAEIPVHIDTSHFTEGPPFDQLTPDHAKNIATGTQTAISNGKTGPDADLGFVSNAELANTVLPYDVPVITDWNLNAKTGEMTPVYTTLQGGKNNALDALIAHDAGMDKFNQKQAMYETQLKAQQTGATAANLRAEAEEHQAAASLNEAYVRQIGTNMSAGNATIPQLSDALQKLSPQAQQALQGYDPLTQMQMIRGAYGFVNPDTFPQQIRKGSLEKIDRETFGRLALIVNPNYTDALWKAVSDTQVKFATGKEADSIRSFNQFLVHAQELKNVSQTVQRTNMQFLNMPLNKLSTQMGQPGVPELMTAIAAARREWQNFIDSGYAPHGDDVKNAQTLMSDASSPSAILGVLGVMGVQAVGRLDQLNEQYRTVMGQSYPNLVTPSGAAAARDLGVDVRQYSSGGTIANGPNGTPPAGAITAGDGQIYTTDQGKTWFVTATGKPYQAPESPQ